MMVTLASRQLAVSASGSLPNLIAKGRYHWVHPDITEQHFPSTNTPDYILEYKLREFGWQPATEATAKGLSGNVFRHATLIELLTFGEQFANEAKNHIILARASYWRNPFGYRGTPGLRWVFEREVGLFFDEVDWMKCICLVVREKELHRPAHPNQR